MARTKQTAKSSTTKKPTQKKINPEPSDNPKKPNAFNSIDENKTFIKKCVEKKLKGKISSKDFEDVWDTLFENNAKIIEAIQKKYDQAENEFSKIGYRRGMTIIKKVNIPIVTELQVTNMSGIGKGITGIVKNVIEGREESYIPLEIGDVFVSTIKDKKKKFKVINIKNSKEVELDNNETITKRANDIWKKKGDRKKEGIFYELVKRKEKKSTPSSITPSIPTSKSPVKMPKFPTKTSGIEIKKFTKSDILYVQRFRDKIKETETEFRNGTIHKNRTYKDGVLEIEDLYKNGELSDKDFYKNDKRDHRDHFENGKMTIRFFFNDKGEQTTYQVYDQNGNIV